MKTDERKRWARFRVANIAIGRKRGSSLCIHYVSMLVIMCAMSLDWFRCNVSHANSSAYVTILCNRIILSEKQLPTLAPSCLGCVYCHLNRHFLRVTGNVRYYYRDEQQFLNDPIFFFEIPCSRTRFTVNILDISFDRIIIIRNKRA